MNGELGIEELVMRKATFWVGTEKDKEGRDISMVADNLGRCSEDETAKEFGGVTVTRTHGSYTPHDSFIVSERGVKLEVITGASDQKLRTHAGWLRNLWNQESVLLTIEPLYLSELI